MKRRRENLGSGAFPRAAASISLLRSSLHRSSAISFASRGTSTGSTLFSSAPSYLFSSLTSSYCLSLFSRSAFSCQRRFASFVPLAASAPSQSVCASPSAPQTQGFIAFISLPIVGGATDTFTDSTMEHTPNRPETPNHALQPTATLAFSCRRAALSSTGSVTAYAPAMKPGIRRACASRRLADTRALGSRWLSLGSLGVSSRPLE